MQQNFNTLMEQTLLPALGMQHTYLDVPASKMAHYAQGYSQTGVPVRMTKGVLSAEAYGIKTTAGDMARFLQINMGLINLDPTLQKAVKQTHTGYFQLDEMTQDLIWEQYTYPVSLEVLLQGNAPALAYEALPVAELKPPQAPRDNVFINKTGATTGFGAYVAFIPQKKLGIVILANKNYPNSERVTAAYQIISALHL